jgi:hypothetical protein
MGGGVAFFEAVAHHHGLGGGSAFVEHGGVGDFETGQVGNERLEIEEGFETALGDLGLVGRVGGIPAWVFQDGALDDAGRVGVVVAHADVAAENLVLRGEPAEFGQGGGFTEGGGEIEAGAADVRRDGGVNEGVEGRLVEELEHRGLFGSVGTVVAAGKGVGRSEQLGEGGGGVRGSGHKKRTVGEAYRPANGFWGMEWVLGGNGGFAGRFHTTGAETMETGESESSYATEKGIGGGLGNGRVG